MLKNQGGVCAICGKPETSTHKSGTMKSLAVDHCHATGKVRGLLCSACNHGIGHLKDSKEIMRAAIKYIEEHE